MIVEIVESCKLANCIPSAINRLPVILVFFGLGALALWPGSEAEVPVYIVGMVLAEFSNGDTLLLKGNMQDSNETKKISRYYHSGFPDPVTRQRFLIIESNSY